MKRLRPKRHSLNCYHNPTVRSRFPGTDSPLVYSAAPSPHCDAALIHDLAPIGPGHGCEFTVEMHHDTAQIYKGMLRQVENNARYSTIRGRVHVMRKQRLREWLEISDTESKA